MPFQIRTDLPPFGPEDDFNPADPVASPLGEEPKFPSWSTTPGGATKVQRRLVCKQSQVMNWLLYFMTEAPTDPYLGNASLWEIHCEPYERQLRVSTASIESLFPGLAYYELAVLTLVYENQGMRFFLGAGLVKEEQKLLTHQVPIGIMRGMTSETKNESGDPAQRDTQPGSLFWDFDDGNTHSGYNMYYGEHPQCVVGMREICITFPFAPTNAEPPFGEGSVNSDAFQLPVTGNICPADTLKYMGCVKEASVVVPAVGTYAGLIRYRKSYIFHYLNANVANAVPGATTFPLTWNIFFRARDQYAGHLVDMKDTTYFQHTPVSFSAVDWWL